VQVSEQRNLAAFVADLDGPSEDAECGIEIGDYIVNVFNANRDAYKARADPNLQVAIPGCDPKRPWATERAVGSGFGRMTATCSECGILILRRLE
jgi:hypothetical protein